MVYLNCLYSILPLYPTDPSFVVVALNVRVLCRQEHIALYLFRLVCCPSSLWYHPCGIYLACNYKKEDVVSVPMRQLSIQVTIYKSKPL